MSEGSNILRASWTAGRGVRLRPSSNSDEYAAVSTGDYLFSKDSINNPTALDSVYRHSSPTDLLQVSPARQLDLASCTKQYTCSLSIAKQCLEDVK